MVQNRPLFACLLALILLVGLAGPGYAQNSCAQLLGGISKSEPIVLPGAPADFQVRADATEISLYRGETLVSTTARQDPATLTNKIYESLGDASLPGQGVRFGFSGLTTAEAANLMKNLSVEGQKRLYGIQEGVVATGGGASGKPPVGRGETTLAAGGEPPKEGGGAGSARGGTVKAFMGKNPSRRYDFTKASVTYAKDSATPIAYEGSGARFVQDFVVDVPSTPAALDFIVRVFYLSKRATEIDAAAGDVITEVLHQPKLSNATLRQAANEIIRELRSTDEEWNAAIEGADTILVEVNVIRPTKHPA